MATQVFLLYTDGAPKSWADPGDWTPLANTVECIGSGGGGSTCTYEGGPGGGGGAGGSYAKDTNMNLSFPVPYCIAIGMSSAPATNFNSASYGGVTTPGSVSATMGVSGYQSSGGAPSGNTFFPIAGGYAGGRGGDGAAVGGQGGGGGGGGAAGPHGAGSAGGNGVSGTVGGTGGAADGGTVAGVAAATNGTNGTTFDATHGCGSGGGGRSTTAVGAGGLYGGGGGGGGNTPAGGGAAALGGKGLIVITYKIPKQVFLLYAASQPQYWPDPGDWNPVNTVECIGSGASGSNPYFSP